MTKFMNGRICNGGLGQACAAVRKQPSYPYRIAEVFFTGAVVLENQQPARDNALVRYIQ